LPDLAVEAPIVPHRRAVIGRGITAAGVVAVVAAVSGAGTGLAALGAAATVAGAVILGPVLVRPVVGTLGRPVAAGRGITGALSRQNAMRNPRRTAAAASALMVGVSVVAVFTVFGTSLKASAGKDIDEALRADVVVDTPGYGGQSGAAGFDPQLTR